MKEKIEEILKKYAGRIVRTYESRYPGAWDNWALPEYRYHGKALMPNGEIEELDLGNSDFGPLPKPDATPEVAAQWQAILEAEAAKKKAAKLEEEERRPTKGKKIRVVRGRKVPQGTTGEVFWYGEVTRYRGHGTEYRVGIIKENGEKVFLPAEYVEVQNSKKSA